MIKYLMFPHNGSKNHGCEAIMRTTVQMIKNCEITLFSNHPEEDKKYIDNVNINILKPQKSVSRASLGYISAFAKNHLFGKADAFDALNFAPVISACDKNTVLMSIGGDNYCYGENEFIYMVNRYARAKGVKTVLWGCSVEPKDISDKMSADLSGYDLITARETITYEALKKINPNTVLVSDPAFTLPVGDGKMPEGLGKNPFIGINVSPLIQKSESKDGITMENYRSLVEYILENTKNDIALIPHVVWDGNDDREPLQKLYDEFKVTGRIFMVEDQNCMQLKGVISKCRFFIGARTHATIAAYSTCVPTLVVGYSVKAKGIAKDLFGTYDNYVLPVQSLKEKDDLTNAFKWLESREAEIKNHLTEIMPAYIEKAWEAKNYLEGLLT